MDNNPETTVETTDATAEGADATEQTVESTEETQQETTDSTSQIDYEAEIEAERKRGPDPLKAKEAFKKRQEKQTEEEGESEDDPDKPLTRREMEAFLQKERQNIFNEANRERIDEIASSIADSDGEKRLIMEIHKNRVFPEGMSLRDQLTEAHFIANGRRLAAKNVEMARKINSKDTATKDAADTHRDPQTAPGPKLASDMVQSLKRAGFTYDNQRKLYAKKLPNGKTLFRDAKTKAQFVE